jgi:hypothetical protein
MSEKESYSSVAIGDELKKVLLRYLEADIPVVLLGEPGVGKSDILHQTAKSNGYSVIRLDLTVLEPVDLAGLPNAVAGKTKYFIPEFLPPSNDPGKGVLVLEDINRASREIRNSLLQLLTSRSINRYVFPPGWRIAGTANASDRMQFHSADTMDPALSSRFVPVKVKADVTEWLRWAAKAGINPRVARTVKADKKLFDAAPPRTWFMVSCVMNVLRENEINDTNFLSSTLGGLISESIIKLLSRPYMPTYNIEPQAILSSYHVEKMCWRDIISTIETDGRLDVLKKLLEDAEEILISHDLENVSIDAVAGICRDPVFPADMREHLEKALIDNPNSPSLLSVSPETVIRSYGVDEAVTFQIDQWVEDNNLRVKVLHAAVNNLVSKREECRELTGYKLLKERLKVAV